MSDSGVSALAEKVRACVDSGEKFRADLALGELVALASDADKWRLAFEDVRAEFHRVVGRWPEETE